VVRRLDLRESEPLHILLLGPPDIRWQGEPLKFSRRAQRALLFYLAVEGKVSREALQELFWPSDLYNERSNANLRVNLARLRKDLPSDEILQTNKDTIWLNRDQVSIDAADFLDLVDQPLRFVAQFPSNALLPEHMVFHLRQAAELWRSPGFLQGFSISGHNPHPELWLERASRRFNDTHLRVLTHLAGHFAAAGDFDAAIQWTEAALDIDPWLENLHIQKIQWSLALNRTGTVLNTIQSLQDQYARENEEIPEELAALIQRVWRQIISFNKNSTNEDWPGRHCKPRSGGVGLPWYGERPGPVRHAWPTSCIVRCNRGRACW
jgi:DNA-binding SARP family transcriptional activator